MEMTFDQFPRILECGMNDIKVQVQYMGKAHRLYPCTVLERNKQYAPADSIQ